MLLAKPMTWDAIPARDGSPENDLGWQPCKTESDFTYLFNAVCFMLFSIGIIVKTIFNPESSKLSASRKQLFLKSGNNKFGLFVQ
jgi:hypothetical protein